jgi:zinc transporter, ZIP family
MSLLRKAPAPTWVLGLVALLLLGATLAALAALAVLGGRSVPESTDPAAEEQELAVESTVLTPGAIELTVQNTSSDPVQIAQVFVNDVYVDLVGGTEPIGRLDTATLRLDYPWQDGQPYLVSMLTSTGSVIEQEISGTADTPDAGPAYIGWMAVLGACVGIVAVLLGMLFLPALRHAWPPSIRMLLAVTVGLLAFLAFDGTAKGLELAEQTGVAFGGAALVVLGAAVAYLLLAGADRGLLRRRRADAEEPGTGFRLALTIAAGIGLYNLCAGLAIGSAYAVGEAALGTALVIGFALHNTTEGIAVVTPLTDHRIADHRVTVPRLLGLAVVAGAPAVAGAVLGASVDNTEMSTFLLGVGVGTIVQMIIRLVPRLRERAGGLAPSTLYGVLAGVLVMYLTGLLVA